MIKKIWMFASFGMILWALFVVARVFYQFACFLIRVFNEWLDKD